MRGEKPGGNIKKLIKLVFNSSRYEEAKKRRFERRLWASAIIFYGAGDLLTSLLVFEMGGVEGNPLLRKFLELGGGIEALIPVKAAVLISSFFIFRRLSKNKWIIPLFIFAAGVMLVIHNLCVLLGILIQK